MMNNNSAGHNTGTTGCTGPVVIWEQTDVLVAGGGTAGVVAAIQAGRAGASTTLVEMSGLLGGTMTNGGVGAAGYFHAWGELQVAGIGWELVKETKELCGEPMPPVRNQEARRPGNYIPINTSIYAALAEEKALQARVTLHYHEIVTGVERMEDCWHVHCVGKNTQRVIQARELIDCTGDADLVGMLNLKRAMGDIRQPGTLEFSLGGYDPDAFDPAQVDAAFAAAIAEGRLRPGDFAGMDARSFMHFLYAHGRNQQHSPGVDGITSTNQSKANLAGRQALLRLIRFIKTLPGGTGVQLEYMSPMTAIRETYRIVGEATVTYEDYIGGRLFPDAICYTAFFVDIHTDEGGSKEFLEPGTLPTIPLGALIPRGSYHILVAGRSVSCDRKAYAGMREQPFCMAMGQAAGAAAALAIRHGIASRDVDLCELKALLKEHGAIVPEGALRDARTKEGCGVCRD